MKKLLTLFFLFISAFVFIQEVNTDYRTFSYQESFDMIENEPDSIFKLSSPLLRFKEKTDAWYFGTEDYTITFLP